MRSGASSSPKSAPCMNMPLTAIEQEIIDAALEFANLRQIESVDQVLGIFIPVAEGTQSPIFQTIRDTDVGAFVDDRDRLVEWLATIDWRRPTSAEREHIWGVLREVLKDTVHGAVGSHARGGIGQHGTPQSRRRRGVHAFAAALLLDRNRGLHRWLQQCELPECRKWFFAWRPRGAPRKLWCPAHDSPQLVQ